jgi:hypothetical protein
LNVIDDAESSVSKVTLVEAVKVVKPETVMLS